MTLLLALTVGCVPKGRHEVVELQLEATRTALDTREANARRALMTAEDRIAELERRMQERDVEAKVLQERIAHLEGEVDTQIARQIGALAANIEACPPLPPLPPCPTCEGADPQAPAPERPPLDEDPLVTERRVQIAAAIEEVNAAVADAARRHAVQAERTAQHERVAAAFQALQADGYAEVLQTEEGTMVRLLVVKLFNENRTTLSPLGEQLVGRMAAVLNVLKGQKLTVVGHTDDRPISSVEHPSNWELGFAYAIGVLRGMEYEGLDIDAQVVSRAGTRPVVPGKTKEARRLNRRVELIIDPDPAVLDRDLSHIELPSPDGGQPVPEQPEAPEAPVEPEAPAPPTPDAPTDEAPAQQ